MARPIEFTTPVSGILIPAFGGAAGVNLLPAQNTRTNYSPLLPGAYYNAGATISGAPFPVASNGSAPSPIPSSTPLVVGYTTNNKIGLQRNLVLSSVADLSGETVTFIGRNAANLPVTYGPVAGPTAAGTITTPSSTNTTVGSAFTTGGEFAYLDSFTCTADTAANNFSLSTGLILSTSPIKIDTFYPNSSIIFGCNMLGTLGHFQPFGTAQKLYVYNQLGIPSLNPNLFWPQLANVNAASVLLPLVNLRSAIYFHANGAGADNTTQYIFFVAQQGVR